MFGAFFTGKAVALPKLRVLFFGWLIAEVVALCVVVKLAGFGGAILLTIASSLVGIVVLRRLGLEAAQRFGRAMAGHDRNAIMVDGTLSAFGALLLIVPGFASDIVGLALTAPSIRQTIRARFFGSAEPGPATAVGRRAPADVIDLSPGDWRVVEQSRRR